MSVETRSLPGPQPGFLLVCGGYIAAVLTASMISLALFSIMSVENLLRPLAFLLFTACTFVLALPGFIATVVGARLLALRTSHIFIIGGILNGFLSCMLLFLFAFFSSGRHSISVATFIPALIYSFIFMPGGLAGGLVYWLIAYRQRRPAA
ncbi:hypothetical protein [Shinella zoogloeoides]|uniref:Uncharacterized protein n=1 Tax=Shinella zoogloeoides TaxID=352475 RepID=A0A6N8T8N7_SHIZO|nr:hypothetical protein [Shinella zoogloeoides]MXN98920.1 hypothetical protein [Shinella zoogloeoides]UEX83363.1 hypothetical protein K8M09_08880 [Shinella zoogloeoides]